MATNKTKTVVGTRQPKATIDARKTTTASKSTSVAAKASSKQEVLKRGESTESAVELKATKPQVQVSKNTTSKANVIGKSTNATTSSEAKATALRANRNPKLLKQTKESQLVKAAKPNAVLDTYHNVTVASPPQKRKESEKPKQQESEPKVGTLEKRARTLSRTLKPEEIVVLKRDSAKQRIAAQIQDVTTTPLVVAAVKQPIAFEVLLDKPKRAVSQTNKRNESDTELFKRLARQTNANKDVPAEPAPNQSKQITPETIELLNEKSTKNAEQDDIENYSDDFESYESDFETGESSTSSTEEPISNTDNNELTESEQIEKPSMEENDENNNDNDHTEDKQIDNDNEDDNSEPTQNPITVIHRDKERERKLDSGHYDMNTRKRLANLTAQSTHLFNSFDTFSTANSEQLDSGISSYGNIVHVDDINSFYGGYVHFWSKPIISKRGLELMSKIEFDNLTYELFEMKPLSYDVFMQTYGKLNTCQISTQTKAQSVNMECQTDELMMRCIWTQHPAQYDLQTIQQLGHNKMMQAVQNCCGETGTQELQVGAIGQADACELSLQQLHALRSIECQRTLQQQMQQSLNKPVDFERLNIFLLNAGQLVSKILNARGQQGLNALLTSDGLKHISQGYVKLDAGFLNALRIRRIFGNDKHQLIITVHECLPENEVYRADFANLLMVWSATECTKPLRLLSTWAEVCRVEICVDCADIVVCGLRDGSVAMWDLRETYSFCSKLDGHLTHFAATQSIVPNFAAKKDLGAVVDVRSFRAAHKVSLGNSALSNYRAIQFATLNDTGVLAVWTLVETNGLTQKQHELPLKYAHTQMTFSDSSRFEYNSPWARIKLTQTAICDLRAYLERHLLKSQSQFDKTKELFKKNIYSDELLRELNEVQTSDSLLRQGQTLQGLRFTSIDTGSERIYVCTNKNFILACTKTLKSERFSRIAINESKFLFPTALCVLSNENYLAVGLSNGSVIILNCNQHKTLLNKQSETIVQPAKPVSATRDIDLETGKSCVIQNIILNERRSFKITTPDVYDIRPTTATFIDMIQNQKRPFELRIYDQQMLLSGTGLRKHLVQSLVLSSDGWRLFALADSTLRVYDFYLDRELPAENNLGNSGNIVDLAVARTNTQLQHLVLLNQDNMVQLHNLSQ